MAGKVIIDYNIIPNFDPRTLLIADVSMWEHIKNKPSIIEITLPGSQTPVVHYFTKGQINVFNSVNLMINCTLPCGCDSIEYNFLPDGIYVIDVKGSPDTFHLEKHHLQTAQTRLDLDKLYVNLDLLCGNIIKEAEKKRIEEIEFLLHAAEANVRIGDWCTAQELLYKAQDKIKTCNLSCK